MQQFTNKFKMTGYCGLKCYKCPAFIATSENNQSLREKTAKEWNLRYNKSGRDRKITPNDINCKGCLSYGPIYRYCYECKTRNCAIKKQVRNCQECKDYKCQELIKLQKYFA